jgi:hypothetical protein
MIDVLRFVVGLAAGVVRGRAGLVAENALAHQDPSPPPLCRVSMEAHSVGEP